jgi:hypothetical protein
MNAGTPLTIRRMCALTRVSRAGFYRRGVLSEALNGRDQSDIPLHGEMREQTYILNDISDASAQTNDVPIRPAVHAHFPSGGRQQAITSFRVVVFPEPLRPSNTRVCPRRTSRFNPESTCSPVGNV